MHSYIHPRSQIVLRLPSGILKTVEILPNTYVVQLEQANIPRRQSTRLTTSSTISIGKFGSFPSNLLLGRPYHLTYEVLDRQDGEKQSRLRIVPASELHAETLSNKTNTPTESRDEKAEAEDGDEFDIVAENGEVIMRNNRLTVDDPTRQALSMEEIEELKRAGTGSGKEIIDKIMAAHSAINEKTSFSLAKYTLRKSKKYMRRFTVLPMDVGLLTHIWLEKDGARILDLREEVLGLMMSWANIHHGLGIAPELETNQNIGGRRYLVLDDTSGLLVAAMAERMGILHQEDDEEQKQDESQETITEQNKSAEHGQDDLPQRGPDLMEIDLEQPETNGDPKSTTSTKSKMGAYRETLSHSSKPRKRPDKPLQSSSTLNTITVLHSNTQPNLSLLKHFGYLAEDPSPDHLLYTNLKTLTWLQLLDPTADALYQEPEVLSEGQIANLKSGKRGVYYRKRRRWEKVKAVVDETREGGFDALVVASSMEPVGIMKHLVPLVRGGGQIVVYSASSESLTLLMDLYSRDRKGAYVRLLQAAAAEGKPAMIDEDDFPVNPTLLLNPMLQTARAREWQVLPQRTHPLMTSRGGSEGYLFTATRVSPAEGVRVEARGKFAKKRKVADAAVAAAEKKIKAE